MTHNADVIVNGLSPSEPGSITRLEAAELDRRSEIKAELERHAAALTAEAERHKRELDRIASAFGKEMHVA